MAKLTEFHRQEQDEKGLFVPLVQGGRTDRGSGRFKSLVVWWPRGSGETWNAKRR
jgi:hypothetical protein